MKIRSAVALALVAGTLPAPQLSDDIGLIDARIGKIDVEVFGMIGVQVGVDFN